MSRARTLVQRGALLWLAGVAWPLVAAASAQDERTLPAPDASFAEPFSSVQAGSVYELPDGRVLVADTRERVVSRVDLRRGQAEQVGREGSGPTEYSAPSRFVAWLGDSVALFDPQLRRYLVFDATGEPRRAFAFEILRNNVALRGMQFRGVDARGRVYREDRDLRRLLASGSGEGVDSIAVVRHALDATGDDTVGVLTERRRATTSQQPAEAGVRRITIANAAPNPVSPRDQWAVFRDGRVVLLRAESYRPEIWSANGQRRLAAPIPHRRIPVTDAVKEAVETQRLALLQHATVMRFGASSDGGPSTSSSGLPAGVRLPPLTDWPDILPAFRPSANALWPLPSGALWVERLDPLDSRGTVFDVLTSDGALSHKVRVPAGLTVVGFGPRSVYTVRHDEDGLAYLQRHPLPGRTG